MCKRNVEKKMTDKDELYREKAGKKASCKKMRGMNEKQKARKKCEIEWGEENTSVNLDSVNLNRFSNFSEP